MSAIINATTETFRQHVVEADTPVIVDFWAPWCGPCKKLGPILEEVATELGDKAQVVKVNVDEERTLAGMFQIMSIPAVHIFNNGAKVDEFVGLRSKADILKIINKQL